MRTALRLAPLALCAVVLAPPATASEAEVRAAEKAWSEAVVGGDWAALDGVLHDELIYSHSTGAVDDRASYFGNLKSGVARYDVIDYERTTVKVFSDSAVTHSIVHMKGQSGDTPFDVNLIMMHVWVKGEGGWRLAAHQTTPLNR